MEDGTIDCLRKYDSEPNVSNNSATPTGPDHVQHKVISKLALSKIDFGLNFPERFFTRFCLK